MAERRGSKDRAGLSNSDLELWRQVTKTTRPLGQRDLERAQKAVAEEKKSQPTAKTRRLQPQPVPIVPKRTPPPELTPGRADGVDRRQAERLRRGQMPISARLDLHGHSQAEAHRALDRFLAEAQAAGKRCVLVVTGRGIGKEAGGVLRRMVPQWLNQPPNRSRILSFAEAQPKHGGAGALYILLRRKRLD